MALVDDARKDAPVPVFALKSLREEQGLGLRETARRAGISHAELRRWESGERPLSKEQARKLAPALGIKPHELGLAQTISGLKRAALEGAVDPKELVDLAEDLAATLPEDPRSEAVMGALLQVLGDALEHHEPRSVAAKSKARERGDRDGLGQKRDEHKPYRPRG